jgi:hypothetical protein
VLEQLRQQKTTTLHHPAALSDPRTHSQTYH